MVVIRAKQEADLAEVILSPFEVSQNHVARFLKIIRDILRELLLLTRIYWLKVVNHRHYQFS